jgi:hypothetical protein
MIHLEISPANHVSTWAATGRSDKELIATKCSFKPAKLHESDECFMQVAKPRLCRL